MASGRKTGGRTKGTPNKIKVETRVEKVQKAADAARQTPLEFMLNAMDDENKDFAVRADMAKAAAPYIHARRVQTESDVTMKSLDPNVDQLSELAASIAALADRLASDED